MKLYIIRHGEPIYNPDMLTPTGWEQARALVARMQKSKIDVIYASSSKRAQETAAPTAEALCLPVNIEDWMNESHAWHELSVENDDGSRRWCFNYDTAAFLNEDKLNDLSNWYNNEAFGGIDPRAGVERIAKASDSFLERLGYKRVSGGVYEIVTPNRDNVACFCHYGFGSTWVSHLLNICPTLVWSGFSIAYTGITVIDFSDKEKGTVVPRCVTFNDTEHIDCQVPGIIE